MVISDGGCYILETQTERWLEFQQDEADERRSPNIDDLRLDDEDKFSNNVQSPSKMEINSPGSNSNKSSDNGKNKWLSLCSNKNIKK